MNTNRMELNMEEMANAAAGTYCEPFGKAVEKDSPLPYVLGGLTEEICKRLFPGGEAQK